MIRGLIRTTLRIDNNLSFNKMLTYIIELGYGTYMEKFDNYYEKQNKKLKSEVLDNE